MLTNPNRQFRLAAFWAILGALGTLAGFPYLLAINPLPPSLPLPLPELIIITVIQSGVLLFFMCWVGLRLGRSLGLDSPFARALVYRLQPPSVSKSGITAALVTGIVGGFIILALAAMFAPFLPATAPSVNLKIDLWKLALTTFAGGITEELQLRLFLLTLIAWVFWKLGQRGKNQPSPVIFWLAIAISALLFGVGHLPLAAAIWTLTPIVIIRTLVLNALLGIAFGFLYWRWGLEYAMLSHFCANIVLHVIGGS